MNTLPRLRVCLSALLVLCSVTASAGWREALPDAQLIGQGDLRFFGFRIYTARLWSTAAPLQPGAPFALELTYHRSIGREDFVRTSLEEIRRLSRVEPDAALLRRWETEMRQAFVDVEPGERIIGVRLPGAGSRFYAGDRLQHEVADPQFSEAFFSIWLDPRSRDQGLRRKLLGQP
jgi:hypothetical protein